MVFKNSLESSRKNFIKFYKDTKQAIIPSKGYPSDIGYDLTCINLKKKINNNTFLYDTGIKCIVPDGYYIEIHPRSSISKSGYILSNMTGIIDPNYRGNLLVCLSRIDMNKPELQLPFKLTQIIIRKGYSFDIKIINEYDITDRNINGFGSTDEKKMSKEILKSSS